MSDQEIIEQFHGILETLRSIVQASSDLATRVDHTERHTASTLEALRSIQASVQMLLETYRDERTKQMELSRLLTDRISALEKRMDSMLGNTPLVM